MSRLSLWIEAYRPDTFNGYVFKNKQIEDKVKEWVSNPDKQTIPIPHLLFTGAPGVGKTTLAKILIKALNVQSVDVLEINASRENNVEIVRKKIVNFCSTWPSGDYKVIFLDEFDGFGQQAQRILRGEMEKYKATVRFIATGNHAHKILPALHSRFQSFHFDALDMESYMQRMVDILQKEKIIFEYEDLMPFINQAYPDLRKGINLLEQHVQDNTLRQLVEDAFSLDYMLDAVELFKAKEFPKGRKLICSQASVDDYEEIYRYLYKHCEIFGESELAQSQAIIYIAQGLRDHGLAADPEICLAATLCRLSAIEDDITT